MGENLPNSNFSITIHQARVELAICSLIISPQILLVYNNASVRTKPVRDFLPTWNETFNFECHQGPISITLLNNPSFYKETTIGTCLINVEKTSGWFEIRNNNQRVGSVRITLRPDSYEKFLQQEYGKKLEEMQSSQHDVCLLKEKYIRKLRKLRENKEKSRECKENNERETTQVISSFKDEKDITKKRSLMKLQEEQVEQEKSRLKQAWKEIENQRKEVDEMIGKIKEEYLECNVAKHRANLQSRISRYSSKSVNKRKTPSEKDSGCEDTISR